MTLGPAIGKIYPDSAMVEIDGSYGEGGGQVLRTALSWAALMATPLTMHNIRAGRSKPGLAAQHITCVRAVAAICDAEVDGCEFGSRQLSFQPGLIQGGEFCFDVADVRPSAGSTSLILQALLPVLLHAAQPSQVTIRGGTNVAWSPTFEYLQYVFVPALNRLGVQVTVERPKAGWYPRGGGEIIAHITPPCENLKTINMADRGELQQLVIASTVSEDLPDHILNRQIEGARGEMEDLLSVEVQKMRLTPAGGPGTAILVAGQFSAGLGGYSALGKKGRPAEKVGAEAGGGFRAFWDSGAAVDEHLADQLLIYLALANGPSVFSTPQITAHLRTVAWVIRQFWPVPIDFTQQPSGIYTVSVQGRSLPPIN